MQEKAFFDAESPAGHTGTAQSAGPPERLGPGWLAEFWNGPAVKYPRNLGLHELIEAQVERTPDAEALRFRSQSLSYKELNARANQVGNYLRKCGVGRDVLVAVCADRSIEMVVALLAILKAGGAYLPIDPEYPADRLRLILREANPPVVLTQSHLLDHFPASETDCLCLDSDWDQVAGESTSNLGIEVGGKDVAYAIYTSGSTGRPKGVLNVHEGIVNRLLWMQDAYLLQPGDRVLQKTPFTFDVSVWEFFWPMLNGSTLLIAEPGGHRDPSYLVKLIQEEQISFIHFVPSMLRIFLETPGVEECRSLKKVFCSGEVLPYETQQRFFERLEAELHNLYGPTEAAVDVTYWACRKDSGNRIVPIGLPIANTQIVILDDNRQPVPVGASGELYIGGVNLARGYLHQPDLTAENFVPNPFPELDTDRLYRTGDLARFLPDGNIEYLGRNDFQVKINGFRIELGEIEANLTACPGVRDAVAIVREDAPSDKRLIAYYTSTSDDSPPIAEELRSRLSAILPEHAVPAAFVRLETLPLTPHGKLDRRALPAPTAANIAATTEYVAPRTQLESDLAAIWQQSLRVERVGVKDNFFDIGGHSLSAMRVVARIRNVFELKFSVSCLFQNPTIESLAMTIDGMQTSMHSEEDLLRILDEIEAMPLANAETE